MLTAHLERFPIRPRTWIMEYAQPRLVDWKLPVGVQAEAECEDQFGMMTVIKCRGKETWVALGSSEFGTSFLSDWTVRIDEPTIYAGITRCERPWRICPMAGEKSIEVGYEYLHGNWCRAIKEFEFVGGSGTRVFEPVGTPTPELFTPPIYACNRRFHFRVDLRTNIFSVEFDGHCVQAIVPDLARYRPFCYFRNGSSRAKASFS